MLGRSAMPKGHRTRQKDDITPGLKVSLDCGALKITHTIRKD